MVYEYSYSDDEDGAEQASYSQPKNYLDGLSSLPTNKILFEPSKPESRAPRSVASRHYLGATDTLDLLHNGSLSAMEMAAGGASAKHA